MKTVSHEFSGIVDPNWKIGIVYSSFYKEDVMSMVTSARSVLEEAKIPASNITVYETAGSFEIPLLGAALAESKAVDALIGLGIIVKGETQHADLLADSTAKGMMDVQTTYRIPFAFEILFVDELSKARERSGKGKEAAVAVLHSLAKLRSLQS